MESHYNKFSEESLQVKFSDVLRDEEFLLEPDNTQNIAVLIAKINYLLQTPSSLIDKEDLFIFKEIRENIRVVALLVKEERLEKDRLEKRANLIPVEQFESAVHKIVSLLFSTYIDPSQQTKFLNEVNRIVMEAKADSK
ncbi:MAG: hypothetical protein AAF316_00155 [Cyanobacteria bacterium P01_A01_bin.80]